ncbi:unnamed protein product [Medioppia subpectinata]|uniref:Uncharacterized protein n=1 Tax=Medioppia subpectinata TaxID=1979941 RepID=A0A7R9KJ50_9ACAR|nr:unnamed protein product [Medioppia subpectinata]CAG2104353.1 unnamed protein product [Medioppia subpectinata]
MCCDVTYLYHFCRVNCTPKAMPRYLGIDFFDTNRYKHLKPLILSDEDITRSDPRIQTPLGAPTVAQTSGEAVIPPQPMPPPKRAVTFSDRIDLIPDFGPNIVANTHASNDDFRPILDTTNRQSIPEPRHQFTRPLSSGSTQEFGNRLTIASTQSKLFDKSFDIDSDWFQSLIPKRLYDTQRRPLWTSTADPLNQLNNSQQRLTNNESFVSINESKSQSSVGNKPLDQRSRAIRLSDLSRVSHTGPVGQTSCNSLPNVSESGSNCLKNRDMISSLDSRVSKPLNETILKRDSNRFQMKEWFNPKIFGSNSVRMETQSVSRNEEPIQTIKADLQAKNQVLTQPIAPHLDAKEEEMSENFSTLISGVGSYETTQWPPFQDNRRQQPMHTINADLQMKSQVSTQPIGGHFNTKTKTMSENLSKLISGVGSYGLNRWPQSQYNRSQQPMHSNERNSFRSDLSLIMNSRKEKKSYNTYKPYDRYTASGQPSGADMDFMRREKVFTNNTTASEAKSGYFAGSDGNREKWTQNKSVSNNMKSTPKPFTPKVMNEVMNKYYKTFDLNLNEE